MVVAHSLHAAREAMARQAPALVLLDRRLPDGDGQAFLPEIRTLAPAAAVVIVTAHADVSKALGVSYPTFLKRIEG